MVSMSLNTADFLDCREWLSNIGLAQYVPRFVSKFSVDSLSNLITKDVLTNLEQTDLLAMNITNTEHQKVLLEAVRNFDVRDQMLACVDPKNYISGSGSLYEIWIEIVKNNKAESFQKVLGRRKEEPAYHLFN